MLIFLLFNVVAGDPTVVMLGKYATAKQMAELRHQLGLDRPWFIQYLDILKSVFTFDFGRSWATQQSIIAMLKSGAWVSLTLVTPSLIITSLLAICLAFLSAFFRNSLLDRGLVMLSIIMTSISSLAYILFGQWLFGYKLGWFPIAGYEYEFPDFITYVMLPSIILIIVNIGYDIRFYRTMVLDEIYRDYVRTARAKGLPEWLVLFRHVLSNVLIPIVTNLIMQLPAFLLGTLLTESFFSIPGLGGIVFHAINSTDFPVIKAITILSAMFYLVLNLVTDIIYTLLDPRIKLS